MSKTTDTEVAKPHSRDTMLRWLEETAPKGSVKQTMEIGTAPVEGESIVSLVTSFVPQAQR